MSPACTKTHNGCHLLKIHRSHHKAVGIFRQRKWAVFVRTLYELRGMNDELFLGPKGVIKQAVQLLANLKMNENIRWWWRQQTIEGNPLTLQLYFNESCQTFWSFEARRWPCVLLIRNLSSWLKLSSEKHFCSSWNFWTTKLFHQFLCKNHGNIFNLQALPASQIQNIQKM